MSLEYLSKYLNKSSSTTKKRKRESKSIVVDDLDGWNNPDASAIVDSPTIVDGTPTTSRGVSGFRPAYVVEEHPSPVAGGQMSIQSGTSEPGSEVMQSGARAGLQTKTQVAVAEKARKERQLKEYSQSMQASGGKEHETVYRDATGRRIDLALARQEKARELKRAELRQEDERSMRQGLVQQQAREARAAELSKVRSEGFSRYAGHAASEAALKMKRRWDDPASTFLRNDESGECRPQYKGGFAPNRFSIRPGYRWDGVDRGNGYEAKRFRQLADLAQRKTEYEDWAKEDM
ncbi:protein of unknown function [Taphrina deformans PYCC 5710]|uniref:Pre-mRNA-splicing factor cwc26 n=1 Tax=Taphrina deformans (strain PYCC 5710 / ATCC 11124 / CBS 356.35 / IMI 108563 / JCM 9778 / NBRC 8474) TaxID=1097556 RepID=R4XM57_TAPDE|nr:protein of unknown function [Taphrina deformans PYCC 5710]|eukprot:CCG84380.1 protein of unknown function [Taphrina deformans PYCC 5710]